LQSQQHHPNYKESITNAEESLQMIKAGQEEAMIFKCVEEN